MLVYHFVITRHCIRIIKKRSLVPTQLTNNFLLFLPNDTRELPTMPSFTVYKGAKDGKVIKSETTKADLQGDQVLLRITASGLCGTDSHFRSADMGLGHEGVGIIEELGPAVTHLVKGDRVGFGYLHNSCGHCEQCHKGTETYCPKRELYGYADLDQGSFASHAVWRESYLFKIPESLSDEAAAPLMCKYKT